ncbi:MAG: hypothetical protein WCC66_14615 [Rhizobiaceae bacterium]
MLFVITKAALVILAGVYAIRASSYFFEDAPFEPLMLVAAFAFVLSVVLFYRPPIASGLWLYAVVALCAIGVLANAMLYFAPDKTHSDAINLSFSAISIAGWAIVGASYASLFFKAQ